MALADLLSAQFISLMAGGGIAAMLGFWLMLREGPNGSAARFMLGNYQVSSLSTGFALFFSGVTAALAPIVAPEALMSRDSDVTEATSFIEANGHGGQGIAPGTIEMLTGRAIEPRGRLAQGAHANEDADWYYVDLAQARGEGVAIEVAHDTPDCHVHLYDDRQRYVGLRSLHEGHNKLDVQTEGIAGYYLKLACLQEGRGDSYTVRFDSAVN